MNSDGIINAVKEIAKIIQPFINSKESGEVSEIISVILSSLALGIKGSSEEQVEYINNIRELSIKMYNGLKLMEGDKSINEGILGIEEC